MDIRGDVPGFSCHLSRFTDPSELLCVTLCCNKGGVELSELARRIAGAFDRKIAPPVSPNTLRSVLGVALRGDRGALLVAVDGAGNSPAIVVVVVQGEQVFHAAATWINAVSIPQVTSDLLDCGGPVAIHVPARAGDS